ncbi:SMI1/KNR4 family protein [Paenibacillus wenxiniae]|uniref:SMI1/KNR4 family protein n=1 Tax=Paenibacillus wenxiniae TaxID=1636843 RepID=A0ABW4RHB7_9BACL
MDMQEIEPLLTEAYRAWGDEHTVPETVDGLAIFELRHHVVFPQPYRILLLRFGPLRFANPVVYGLKQLEWAYPQGVQLIAEYRQQDAGLPDRELFPIGSFGDGDLLVLEEEGAVFRLYHDGYDESPLEPIAPDLPSLLADMASWALDVNRRMKEK